MQRPDFPKCRTKKGLPVDNNFVARAMVSINAPRSRVWHALTDPETIKQYMFGATVESEWREGGSIIWKGVWHGKPYEDKGVILRFTPQCTLSYSHYSPLSGLPDKPENYHTVTIELTEVGGQTHVVLAQDRNASEEERAHSELTWRMMLSDLKKLVEQESH
jgi:uncharacterized protein YndB with AHSA1/START domain